MSDHKPQKAPRITFRREGYFSHEEHIISANGKKVGRIAQVKKLWYWYTTGGDRLMNTASNPTTLEACKEQAKEFFREPPAR
jgi:hypothetical protein